MRTLLFILEKEYRQIFRNKVMLRMMFLMPVIQLILLPNAANYEVKNIHIAITDMDGSSMTRNITNRIASSKYFILESYNHSYKQSLDLVEKDKVDVILQFPLGSEKRLVKEKISKVFVALNAINGVKANVGGVYLSSMLQQINQEIRIEWMPDIVQKQNAVSVVSTNKYNPHFNYKQYMVPGILVILLTMIGSNLTSSNIVREKEIGTIEQINVTPIKKYQFILGKLIPFWTLGLVALTMGLIIAFILYRIIPVGSYLTVYLFSMVYLFAILGFGLLLSTLSNSQQQSTLTSFFIMMIFILLSGLYTSVDSMPSWAKILAYSNPVTYFIEVMRMVVLKGSSLFDIRFHVLKMLGFALFFNGLAIWSYKKRS